MPSRPGQVLSLQESSKLPYTPLVRSLCTFLVSLLITPVALGQEGASSGYPGVAPGKAQEPPSVQTIKAAKARQMTWPGFQMRPDGGSRVFVQVTEAPVFTVRREGARWVVLLKDTGIHLKTNRLPLETQFFATPVQRVRIERIKKDVAIVLELRDDATPEVRTEAAPNGYHYVLIDFAPTVPVAPAKTPPASRPSSPPATRPSAPAEKPPARTPTPRQASDDERPPGFRATLRTR